MTYYVGIIDGAGDVWGVRFPDIPGCVGAGPTPEEAVADATAALRDVMDYKRNGGFDLPAASGLSAVLSSGDVGEGEHTVLIPLLLDSGRTVRANLTFDAGLLAAIDSEAARRGLTRSAFLASAARDKIIGRHANGHTDVGKGSLAHTATIPYTVPHQTTAEHGDVEPTRRG